jgi:hypothetical protein
MIWTPVHESPGQFDGITGITVIESIDHQENKTILTGDIAVMAGNDR